MNNQNKAVDSLTKLHLSAKAPLLFCANAK